jgi:hypothetical protein
VLTVSVAEGMGAAAAGVRAVSVGAGWGAGAAGLVATPAGGAGGGLGAVPGKLIAGGCDVLTAPDGLIGACAEAVAASDDIAAAATALHKCLMPQPP